MIEKTFAMIKPDGVSRKLSGRIIDIIELNGFSILKIEKKHLTRDEASSFYSIHSNRAWFNELIDYITSSEVVLLCLERENGISEWRNLIGATNPESANVGTIRKMFAESISSNVVHGSDSEENAEREINFFFKKK
jgi:nucleoside-diphosphate kinase